MAGGFLSRFSRFDQYTKAQDEIQVRTLTGGVVTMCAAGLMLLLFFSEFAYYRRTEIVNNLRLDADQGSKSLNLILHLKFPHVPCKDIHVGAANNKGQTVDVHDALRKLPYVEPKELSNNMEKWQGRKDAPGCNLGGVLELPRAGGTLAITAGADLRGLAMLGAITKLGVQSFNTTHEIEKLAFGERYPGLVNPLNEVNVVSMEDSMAYQYFAKVVPTKYSPLYGKSVESMQYSVTEHGQSVKKSTGSGHSHTPTPGIYLRYDVSPLQLNIVEEHRTFLQFVTSVCAIVGGVFTVSGMIDASIYKTAAAIRKAK